MGNVKYLYKGVLSISILIFLQNNLSGQEHFNWERNTGNYATIGVLLENEIIIKDESIAPGDEIGVFTPDGMCVGGTVWDGESNKAITVWGNNIITDEIDGILENEKMHFRVWQKSTNTEYEVIKFGYEYGDGIYKPDGIYVISFLHAYELVDTPIQLFPENDAVNTPVTMEFQWQKDPKAASYTFQLSTAPDFSEYTFNEHNNPDASFMVEDIENDTKYYWRVGAVDYGGDTEWSEVWSFTTIIAHPAVPVLAGPENNAIHISTDTMLVWDEAERAETYHVQLSTVSDFSSLEIDSTGIKDTNVVLQNLENDKKYYWRVRSANIAGESAWSETQNFTTIIALPDIPALATPENDAVHIPIDTELTWNKAERAENYEFQLSKVSDFSSLALDNYELTATKLTVNDLENDIKYYWRVRSKNIAGMSEWSDVRSFTTIIAEPAPPQLILPMDDALHVLTDTVLVWDEAERAETYQVQVSTVPDFSTVEIEHNNLNLTEFMIDDLANDTKYFWRVRSSNIGGLSDWSKVWSFTTIIAIPEIPVLVSPEDGALHIPIDTMLVWNEMERAETYQVQVSKVSDFSIIELNSSSIDDTQFEVNNLTNDTEYFWRVRSENIAGASDWSQIWSFTTSLSPPVLTSPENSADHIMIDTLLVWNAIDRAETYDIQLSIVPDFSNVDVQSSGVIDTTFAVQNLKNDTIYYWRVRSANSDGVSEWSSVWSFTTIVAPPEIPVIATPENGATHILTDTLLKWIEADRAEAYHVQLSCESDFSSMIVDSAGITITEIAVANLDNSTDYYWRVRSVNIGGKSDWSEFGQFTTIIALPDVPVLVSPENDAAHLSIDTLLEWNESNRAEYYHVQLSKVPDFTSIARDSTGLSDVKLQVNNLENDTKYYWRVRSVNVAGTSEWSGIRNFTTIVAPPDIPQLVSPADVSNHIPVNTKLQWNETESAEAYQVQLSRVPDFTSVEVDTSGLTTAGLVVEGLINDTKYYWRVRSENITGESEWSAVWSFRTIVAPPAVPVLASPDSGAINVLTDTVLTWETADRAEVYHIQVSTDSGFSSTMVDSSGIAGMEFAVTGLEHHTEYYWRVRSGNVAGKSEWSGNRSFTTILASPVYVSPEHNANHIPVDTELVWSEVTGAETYHVQLSNEYDFANTVVDSSGMTGTELAITNLGNGTDYYWRVRSANSEGVSVWSPVWRFTTIVSPPDIPVLATPENGALHILTDTLLVWNETERAETYHVQFSDVSDFTGVVIDSSGIPATELGVHNLANNTKYYWRVRSMNIAGESKWSDTYNFTTIVARPDVPELVSPENGALDLSIDTVLVWSESARAESYHIQFSKESDFSSMVIDSSGVGMTELSVHDLDKDTKYYWRVRAVNRGGGSGWSEVWSFRTIVAPPAVPVLASPDSGAINVLTDTVLTWETADRAEVYHVQVSTDSGFSSMMVDSSGITETEFAVTGLEHNTEYYWRVRSGNVAGKSEWSGIRSFTTIVLLAGAPAPLSPENEAIDIATDTLLVWRETMGATSYHVQLSKEPDFSSTVIDSMSITATKLRVNGLLGGSDYYWRFRAVNGISASEWSKVWRFRTKAVTSVGSISDEIPVDFALDQNYPNPFNPSTTIRFAIPTESPVRLEIYNMLGQHVVTLIDGENYRAGVYESMWYGMDASGREVSGGIYIYRIVAGDYVEAKRMIMIK